MLAKVHSLAVIGMDCEVVEVESHVSNGFSGFSIVGLGDTAVQESKERVRSALKNTGFKFPANRITVNLAPAEVRKNGSLYDLPIAIGLLFATGQIVYHADLSEILFVGELALDGSLRHINGVLSMMVFAKKQGFKRIVIPKVNASEASVIDGVEILAADHILELIDYFSGEKLLEPVKKTAFKKLIQKQKSEIDFAYIKGQQQAKRCLEIAAAGSHNILMCGSPGSGKTLMARAFQSILPVITMEESLEVSKIYSIANKLPKGQALITERPFRTIHHTASAISIIGGGKIPMPGEISLAHKGVLFFDELPEFPGHVLEVLRQPLEDKSITITRTNGTCEFPAHFTFLSAMNPCPCGYYNVPHARKECSCSHRMITQYQKKISGPLLDRIDLYTDISPVEHKELKSKKEEESSSAIRKRVQKARDIQTKRFKGLSISSNAEMGNKEIKEFCTIPQEAEQLLELAIRQMNLSARAYCRVLKTARTIADLVGREDIISDDVAEALQYRKK